MKWIRSMDMAYSNGNQAINIQEIIIMMSVKDMEQWNGQI
jgi:hypothetical protein